MSEALDRLVSEKVMGWTVNKELSPYRWAVPLDQGLLYDCWDQTPATKTEEFSTSISAAWEVVEHLRKQRHTDGGRRWLVSMIDHTDSVEIVVEDFREGDRWYAVNESAPMAICLAALRAVGVPEATIQEACK